MIRTTVFHVDVLGFATTIWQGQTDTPVASSYLHILFDPADQRGAHYVCVEEAIPPCHTGPWGARMRVQRWLRLPAFDLHGRPNPQRPILVWTWDPTRPLPRGTQPDYVVPLRRRLVALEVVTCDGPWRDDDPVLHRFDLSGLLPDEALLQRDELTRLHGGRADQRLRETWTRP